METITPETIAEVVAGAANILVGKLPSAEREKLIKMECTLVNIVVGQPICPILLRAFFHQH